MARATISWAGLAVAVFTSVACGNNSGGPVAISISPVSISLRPNGKEQFTADVTGTTITDVTWSVAEGNAGGSVTGAGLYTAPAAAGTFHVLVTSQADTTQIATAVVTVTNSGSGGGSAGGSGGGTAGGSGGGSAGGSGGGTAGGSGGGTAGGSGGGSAGGSGGGTAGGSGGGTAGGSGGGTAGGSGGGSAGGSGGGTAGGSGGGTAGGSGGGTAGGSDGGTAGGSGGGTAGGSGGGSIVGESDGDTTSSSSTTHMTFAQGASPKYLDVVGWRDADGQTRTITLEDNNQVAGGVASQMTYQDTVANQAVTLAPAVQDGNPVDGYGYAVSHYGGGYGGTSSCAMNGDGNSPVSLFPGATKVVFQGRNHLIYEITFSYPREGQDGTCYQVPVTIDWVFASGRSYPVYSITWNVAGSGAGGPGTAHALYPADSRAPYGAMAFDGSGQDYIEFSKLSWADYVYSFETLTTAACMDSAVCMDSGWTWSTRSNGFAFVQSDAMDAARSFAIMATNSGQYMPGGGYADSVQAGTDGRGKTSASRGSVLCDAPGGDGIDVPPGPYYTMPCVNDGWPYQSLNYELAYSTGMNTDTYAAPMVSWGTEYYLGTTITGANTAEGLSAAAHGITLSPAPASAVGYPEASYSTYVVYGPTTEVSGFQSVVAALPSSFTPDGTTAKAVTACPAGAGRSDTISCAPASYDQAYAALRVTSVNGTSFGFTPATAVKNLAQLTVVVENYTGATIPATLTMAGTSAALANGTGYYASLRKSTKELWITFASVPATGKITAD